MRNVEPKKRNKSTRVLLTFLGCSVLCLVLLVAIIKMGTKLVRLYENKKTVEAKLTELENQKSNLASSIESLSTDSGVEETIRDKYFVAKEGEEIVVVVEEDGTTKKEETGGFKFFKKLIEFFK